MKLLVFVGLSMLALSTHVTAQERSLSSGLCVVESSSYVVHRGEAAFAQTAQDLNTFFSATKMRGSLMAPSQDLADQNTEVIQVDADVARCSDKGPSNVGIASIGGCDYVGCTGSLPSDFHSLPPGSTVTMTACGGGTRTSGTFQKQSNNSWVMTRYETEQVTQCDPTG